MNRQLLLFYKQAIIRHIAQSSKKLILKIYVKKLFRSNLFQFP